MGFFTKPAGERLTSQSEDTLAAALLFVERTVREMGQSDSEQLFHEFDESPVRIDLTPSQRFAIMELLKRAGEPVPAPGDEREVAISTILIMSLVFSDKCNGLILTESPGGADDLWCARLFSSRTIDPRGFANRCGKRLRMINLNLDQLEDIGDALQNPDRIPVMSYSAFHLLDTLNKKNRRIQGGLAKLNCVVRVSPGVLEMDDEVGTAGIERWAMSRGISN